LVVWVFIPQCEKDDLFFSKIRKTFQPSSRTSGVWVALLDGRQDASHVARWHAGSRSGDYFMTNLVVRYDEHGYIPQRVLVTDESAVCPET
jgi:hypothetical protein